MGIAIKAIRDSSSAAERLASTLAGRRPFPVGTATAMTEHESRA